MTAVCRGDHLQNALFQPLLVQDREVIPAKDRQKITFQRVVIVGQSGFLDPM